MKASTMLDTIRSLLGAPACAIPLSVCKPGKTYLLDRVGIPPTGTAILFAIPYVMTADVDSPDRNVSLYAVPRDYHGYVKELEVTLLPALRNAYPGRSFALFADHSPIMEVDAAVRAGLGVRGLNGLLITPEYGSFVFIGEIVTDADYVAVTGENVPSFPADPTLCEECGACLRACPVGLCDGDRTRCLSALTQKKGLLTLDEESAILSGGLVWGCDRCQLACPHNRRVLSQGTDTLLAYFREARLLRVHADDIAAMSDEAFASRAYSWRGKAVITRNCLLLETEKANHSERRES